jgi:hypothetical protein
MHYFNKECRRTPKKIVKRRRDEHALKNVISLRISDEEKNALDKLTKSTSKSITEIMREAIDLWSFKRRKLCME